MIVLAPRGGPPGEPPERGAGERPQSTPRCDAEAPVLGGDHRLRSAGETSASGSTRDGARRDRCGARRRPRRGDRAAARPTADARRGRPSKDGTGVCASDDGAEPAHDGRASAAATSAAPPAHGATSSARVRDLAEHVGRVERLDARRRQREASGLAQAHGVLDGEAALRHEVVVGAEAVERALDEDRRDAVVGFSPAASSADSRAEAGAEVGGAGRDRIVDDDPGHVALGVDLEPHAQHVAAAGRARRARLDRRHRLGDAVAGGERRGQRQGGAGLDGRPRPAAAACASTRSPLPAAGQGRARRRAGRRRGPVERCARVARASPWSCR